MQQLEANCHKQNSITLVVFSGVSPRISGCNEDVRNTYFSHLLLFWKRFLGKNAKLGHTVGVYGVVDCSMLACTCTCRSANVQSAMVSFYGS